MADTKGDDDTDTKRTTGAGAGAGGADKTREKVTKTLSASLPGALAASIEAGLFASCGKDSAGKAYRTLFRNLTTQLKDEYVHTANAAHAAHTQRIARIRRRACSSGFFSFAHALRCVRCRCIGRWGTQSVGP